MAELGLQKQGWHLSKDGIAECCNGKDGQNTDSIIKAALDLDIRQIGAGFLPNDINRGKIEYVTGPCVLQIQKIRNVTAPKSNEESQHAPRMLRFHLTDGPNNCLALEMDHIDKLSLSTPPGTKLKLTGHISVQNGFLHLDKHNTKVLGGRVEKLITKWELARSLAQHSRNYEGREGGPPPWIQFGQKRGPVNRDRANIRDFKSLDTNKEHSEQDKEFEQQRKAVIEATLHEGKSKTFGGGSAAAQNLQKEKDNQRRPHGSYSNTSITSTTSASSGSSGGIYRQLSSGVDDKALQKLIDMGFQRERSISALKEHSDDVDAAINTLLQGQQQQQQQPSSSSRYSGRQKPGRGRSGRGRGRGGDDDDIGDGVSSRPSGPSTLFDFLETQLGSVSITDKETTNSSYNRDKANNRYEQYKQHDRYDDRHRNYDHRSSHRDNNRDTRDHRQQHSNRRNYEQQPQSVRDAGITFVHGERPQDTRKGGRDTRSAPENRYHNDHDKNTYQRRDNQSQRNQTDHRQDRYQDRQASNKHQQSRDLAPRSDNRQHFNDRQNYDNRTHDNRQDNSRYNRHNRSENTQDRQGNPQVRGEHRQDRQNWTRDDGRHDNRERDRPESGHRQQQQQQQQQSHSEPERETPLQTDWKKGDPCLAKYWEDNRFYPAQIFAVDPKLPTAVVLFTEYGNHEEILLSDIQPLPQLNSLIGQGQGPGPRRKYENFEGSMSETLEFRQGGGGNYRRRPQNQEGQGPFRNQRDRRPPGRPQQQYYQPPAARK